MYISQLYFTLFTVVLFHTYRPRNIPPDSPPPLPHIPSHQLRPISPFFLTTLSSRS